MEQFVNEIGERLENAARELEESAADDLKHMHYVAYSETATCFSGAKKYPEALQCSEAAIGVLRQYKTALKKLMEDPKRRFQYCFTGCGPHQQNYLSDDLHKCLNECTEASLKEFKSLEPEVQALARKHRK